MSSKNRTPFPFPKGMISLKKSQIQSKSSQGPPPYILFYAFHFLLPVKCFYCLIIPFIHIYTDCVTMSHAYLLYTDDDIVISVIVIILIQNKQTKMCEKT